MVNALQNNQAVTAAKVLVAGLGATGLSVARFLARRGVAVTVADTRESPPGLEALQREHPEIRIYVGTLPASVLDEVGEVVASPGLDLSLPFFAETRARAIPIIGDIELFARVADAPILAITGSNGKSTVTGMVAALLKASGRNVRAGGNLGPAALALIGDEAPDFYVLELSSFQLQSVYTLEPAVAAVLNISADHIDRHGSVDAYAAAKAKIFEKCHIAVVNRDDPRVMRIPTHATTVSFGFDAPAREQFGLVDKDGEPWLARGSMALLRAAEIPLIGRHNVANALAALAIASAAGAPAQAAAQALRKYRGLPHRMQRVASVCGATWVNDSKGTNVGATVAAIRGLSGNLVLIAGGEAKGADFSELADAATGRVHSAILIGRDASLIGDALENRCTVHYEKSMDDAVRTAAEICNDGDTVLLSPACASFDMFSGFEERGDVFARAVRRLTP
ncbi:MAG: UDP-N-acetylmuramoyl-L-alanine--D-glutamate ligase [Gammaproteobacteria bacterium]|nr:UDP-N-acetylmuramoyl-L-alanine--D-glutamate ligase [Gammaproteobacteria bacterium]